MTKTDVLSPREMKGINYAGEGLAELHKALLDAYNVLHAEWVETESVNANRQLATIGDLLELLRFLSNSALVTDEIVTSYLSQLGTRDD